MRTTWILVADSTRARIFEKKEGEEHLEELKDFVNTAGRAENRELRTDEHGRFYGKGEGYQGHTAQPSVLPTEHENAIFSHTLTEYLNDARNTHRYNRLYIVAPPKFLGLIRGNLNVEVEKMVEEELPNNISTYKIHEVENYLKQKIDFL